MIQERVYSANEYADAQDCITTLEAEVERLKGEIANYKASLVELAKAGADAAGDAVVSHKRCDELETELADWREASRRIMAEECAPDEKHCTCVPALREEIERLKNQAAHYSKAMWAIDREKNGYAEQVEQLQAMMPTKPEGADRLFWLMKPVLAKPFVLGEED